MQIEQQYALSANQIESYRRDGFIQLENVFAGNELAELRDGVASAVAAEANANLMGERSAAAAAAAEAGTKGVYEQIFTQKVNLWRRHPRVARFVLSPYLGNLAAELEGVPMRIWHDQALFKEPHTGNNKTPWHQDAVYWPHADRSRQTTIWIALQDATIHNGCMSFVAGTHKIGPLPPSNLSDPQDIFNYAPHIKPVKPKTIELKAGSVTFHNGLTFHYAGPNKSNGTREAFAIIYMPADTRLGGDGKHVVTSPLLGKGLEVGQIMDGEMFPIVSGMAT
jgi:phytanoyl-CoA hydroxylase